MCKSIFISSLFHADDIPILWRVVLSIDYQVNDVKVGVQLLEVIQINLFKLLLVVGIGLLGQCVRFVVIFGPSQYPCDGYLSRAVRLQDDKHPVVFGCYCSSTPPQRLRNEGGVDYSTVALGETLVIFTAGLACILILMKRRS